MDAIEKRARELLAATYRTTDYPPMVHESKGLVHGRLDRREQAALDAIIAALLQSRPVDLLDQDGASRIEAQELQVVPSAAFGADEAGSVGVDQVSGGLPRDIQLAEVAPEVVASGHLAGVRPEGDGAATADHVEDERKLVKRALVLQILASHTTEMEGYSYFSSNPGIPEDHYEEIADEIVAALTPPEGYVLVPVELPVEMEIAFMEAWVSKRRCIDDPEMQDAWEAALAARPEVKP